MNKAEYSVKDKHKNSNTKPKGDFTMKKIVSLFAALAVVAMMLSFAACGGDMQEDMTSMMDDATTIDEEISSALDDMTTLGEEISSDIDDAMTYDEDTTDTDGDITVE